jgi:hypothetical protein
LKIYVQMTRKQSNNVEWNTNQEEGRSPG